jgi:hypothetical protein
MITGTYNEWGYTILDGNREVYTAGNHPKDSGQSTGSEYRLSLREIRSFCIATARDIAKERGKKYGGVQREDQ